MIRQAAPQSNERVKQKVLEILESGQYVKGPEADQFEQKFGSVNGCRYNISCNSGTSALNLIFFAMDYPTGSEIIVPDNSFLASANAIETAGYKPVFCDIDEDTMNIKINAIENCITDKTKAILVVHLYGSPADMASIMSVANKYNLDVFEDAAQAHGSTFNGQKIGSFGLASAFSLFPTKNLSVLGDGGIVGTNDEELYKKINALKNAGRTDKADDAEYFGYNFRLSEILAGIGNVLLEDFPNETKRRQEIANMYTEGLRDVNQVKLPKVHPDAEAVWHQYTIKTDKRDELKDFLKRKEIQTSIKYGVPLHLVTAFKQKYDYNHGEYPVTEKVCDQLLCLPMHPHLQDEEVAETVKSIKEFFGN